MNPGVRACAFLPETRLEAQEARTGQGEKRTVRREPGAPGRPEREGKMEKRVEGGGEREK